MIIDLRSLLKSTLKSSISIIIIGIIIMFLINPKYINPFVVGFMTSLGNFIISGLISKKSINSKSDIKGIMLMVSFVIRIIIISAIGLLLLLQNQYNVILYIIGYMSNFISLFMAIKIEERK